MNEFGAGLSSSNREVSTGAYAPDVLLLYRHCHVFTCWNFKIDPELSFSTIKELIFSKLDSHTSMTLYPPVRLDDIYLIFCIVILHYDNFSGE